MGSGVREPVAFHGYPRVDAGFFTGRTGVGMSRSDSGKRIAGHLFQAEHCYHGGVAIGAEEATAEAVDSVAELSGTGDGFKFHGAGVEAEVDSGNIDRFGGFKAWANAANLSMAIGAPDAIIESHSWAANLHLGVGRSESFEPGFRAVGRAIVVVVRKVHDCGFRARQNSGAPCKYAVAEFQVLGEDGALVHFSIVIQIFEQHDL